MIEDFLAGADSPEVLAELRRRIEQWMLADSDVGLHRCIGLPGRQSARLARRDAILRAAAASMPGRTGTRARALCAACRAFEVRRWPRWQRTGVPEHASEIDRALCEARRFGSFPTTERQMRNVLCPD